VALSDTADRYAFHKAYNEKCAYCGGYIWFNDFEIDHVLPRHLADDTAKWAELLNEYGLPGDFDVNSDANRVASCRACNSFKAGRLLWDVRFRIQVALDHKSRVQRFRDDALRTRSARDLITKVAGALSSGVVTREDVLAEIELLEIRPRDLDEVDILDRVRDCENELATCDRLYLDGRELVVRSSERLCRSRRSLGIAYALLDRRLAHSQALAESCVDLTMAGLHVVGMIIPPAVRRKWFETGLKACELLDKPHAQAVFMLELARAYEDMGFWTQAAKDYKESYELGFSSENIEYAASSLCGRARLLMARGATEGAVHLCRTADELLPRVSRDRADRLKAHTLAWRGRCLVQLHHNSEGFDSLARAADLAQELGAARIDNVIQTQHARALAALGDIAAATDVLESAFAWARAAGDASGQMESTHALVEIHHNSHESVSEEWMIRLRDLAEKNENQRLYREAQRALNDR
jgi:tetratricopeptide (TPR) repeat protein